MDHSNCNQSKTYLADGGDARQGIRLPSEAHQRRPTLPPNAGRDLAVALFRTGGSFCHHHLRIGGGGGGRSPLQWAADGPCRSHHPGLGWVLSKGVDLTPPCCHHSNRCSGMLQPHSSATVVC